jgi:hypothetical protein
MFVVYFLENKNLVLSQLRQKIPAIDENLTIKGRKAKVLSVTNVEGNHVHVQVALEKVVKKGFVDLTKKKKK